MVPMRGAMYERPTVAAEKLYGGAERIDDVVAL
jgi:hypothetical protein